MILEMRMSKIDLYEGDCLEIKALQETNFRSQDKIIVQAKIIKSLEKEIAFLKSHLMK